MAINRDAAGIEIGAATTDIEAQPYTVNQLWERMTEVALSEHSVCGGIASCSRRSRRAATGQWVIVLQYSVTAAIDDKQIPAALVQGHSPGKTQ